MYDESILENHQLQKEFSKLNNQLNKSLELINEYKEKNMELMSVNIKSDYIDRGIQSENKENIKNIKNK
jgi:hypothetical protein